MWYKLSIVGIVICDKILEAFKFTILGYVKQPHQHSTWVDFHHISFGDLIKVSYHLFYFGDTNNYPSNVDIVIKDNDSDISDNEDIIIADLSKRCRLSPVYIHKLLSSHNNFSAQQPKYITIGIKCHFQINTSFIYVYNHNHTHFQPLVYWVDNGVVYGEGVTIINIYPHHNVNIE